MKATTRVLLVSALWGIVLGYPLGTIFNRKPYEIDAEILMSSVVVGCVLTGLIWLRSLRYQGAGWFYRWLNAASWASLCAMISSTVFVVLSAILMALTPGLPQLDSETIVSILISLWGILWLGPLFALVVGWMTLAIPVLALPWILSLEVAKGQPQT